MTKIFEGVLKVRKEIKTLVFVGIINAILIIGLSGLLMSKGLMGIASAWIGGYFVSLVVLWIVGLKR